MRVRNFKEFLLKEGYEFPFKMVVSNNTLSLTTNNTTISIPLTLNNSVKTARVTTTKQDIEVDVFQIRYNDLKKALYDKNITIQVTDNNGVDIEKGDTTDNIYLIISTPKGKGGEIKSVSTVIGRGGNTTKIVGELDTTWGFYKIPDIEGLDSSKPVEPYKNVQFSKKIEQIVIDITTPFEFDSSNLSNEAKQTIKSKLITISDKSIEIKFMTGASLDGEPTEKAGKTINNKPVTRQEWDFDLTTKRYNATNDYIKSLGFTNIKQVRVPKDVNDVNNIYGKFDSNNKKSEVNRKLLVKVS